jgi:hypothetical protein
MSEDWLKNLVDETYDLEINEKQRLRFEASKKFETTPINQNIFRFFSPKGYLDFPVDFIKNQTADDLLFIFNWAFSGNWAKLNIIIDNDKLEILLFNQKKFNSDIAA